MGFVGKYSGSLFLKLRKFGFVGKFTVGWVSFSFTCLKCVEMTLGSPDPQLVPVSNLGAIFLRSWFTGKVIMVRLSLCWGGVIRLKIDAQAIYFSSSLD